MSEDIINAVAFNDWWDHQVEANLIVRRADKDLAWKAWQAAQVSEIGATVGTISVGDGYITDRTGPFSALPEGEYKLVRCGAPTPKTANDAMRSAARRMYDIHVRDMREILSHFPEDHVVLTGAAGEEMLNVGDILHILDSPYERNG